MAINHPSSHFSHLTFSFLIENNGNTTEYAEETTETTTERTETTTEKTERTEETTSYSLSTFTTDKSTDIAHTSIGRFGYLYIGFNSEECLLVLSFYIIIGSIYQSI